MQEISTPSTAFFSYFRSYSHILLSQVKLKEQSQNRTSQHQCSVVFLSLSSLFHRRISSVWIPTAVPLPLMTGSSESSPSSPNTKPEPLQGRCCCSANTSLSGPSCASAPLPMPDSRQRSPKYVVKSSKNR